MKPVVIVTSADLPPTIVAEAPAVVVIVCPVKSSPVSCTILSPRSVSSSSVRSNKTLPVRKSSSSIIRLLPTSVSDSPAESPLSCIILLPIRSVADNPSKIMESPAFAPEEFVPFITIRIVSS